MDKVICSICHRSFFIFDTTEKKIKCPFCDAVADNPYYVEIDRKHAEFWKVKK